MIIPSSMMDMGTNSLLEAFSPSLRAVAKALRISVLTVTRAYTELEQEGFVTNIQGKGCFVRREKRYSLKRSRKKIEFCVCTWYDKHNNISTLQDKRRNGLC